MQASTCRAIAHEILSQCLEGQAWSAGILEQLLFATRDPDPGTARNACEALFQVLAEGLADRFEPELSMAYAQIFSQAIAMAAPALNAQALTSRYQRIRRLRPFRRNPDHIREVFVLSRVTLGADIAVTSVVLSAAKRRFPSADVILVGGEKSRQLFAADPRIHGLAVSYSRGGTLQERLALGPELQAALARPDSIVIDPDSRLTQLGLLPVCPEEDYFFFDSRSYGGDGSDSLTTLTQRWVGEVFEVADATPYIAPAEAPDVGLGPAVAVNLGVGGNQAKRVPDPFEEELLRALVQKDTRLVVDLGAGKQEKERVREAIRRCGAPPSRVQTWNGSFAGFASIIARSRLYVGYDSAGQHAAAACGTPLVTVFAGFPSPRMFARWYPSGPGPKEVVRVDSPDPRQVLEQTLAAIERLQPPTCTSRR